MRIQIRISVSGSKTNKLKSVETIPVAFISIRIRKQRPGKRLSEPFYSDAVDTGIIWQLWIIVKLFNCFLCNILTCMDTYIWIKCKM